MHPGCIQAIILLEDCISNGELALSAELEQEATIVMTVTNAVPSKDSFPGNCVPHNSSSEVALFQDLIICKSFVQISARI